MMSKSLNIANHGPLSRSRLEPTPSSEVGFLRPAALGAGASGTPREVASALAFFLSAVEIWVQVCLARFPLRCRIE